MSEASKGEGAAWDPPGLWGSPSRSHLSFWGSSRPSLCFEGGYGPGGARGALCVRKRGLGGRGFPGPAGMEEGAGPRGAWGVTGNLGEGAKGLAGGHKGLRCCEWALEEARGVSGDMEESVRGHG